MKTKITKMKNDVVKPEVKSVHNSNEFVGIRIEEGSLKIFIPEVLRLSQNEREKNKELLLFLKSISIAKTIKKENIKNTDNDDHGDMWPFDSYLWIINDYLENGYFYNREKKLSKNKSGKIDWKRTLKTVPIYSNGNIIYDKFVTTNLSATNDIVAQIYKLCLSHSLKKIGWAFNLYMHIDVQQLKTIKEMVYIINNELSLTFDDLKRMRYKHILKILNGINGDRAILNKYTYGIKNYYHVFEEMIDIFLNGIEEKGQYYPSGFWQIEGEFPCKSSNLRPDTIYIKKDEIFIIDSKMYSYGITGLLKNLPNTSSMQKQITYGDFVKNNLCPGAKVRNVFIIPYNKNTDKFIEKDNFVKYYNGNLIYIGKAYVDWRNDNKQEHDYIFTFMIDFNYLLKNYKTKDLRIINKICQHVDQNLDSLFPKR